MLTAGVVEEDGFEPSKRDATDLQSAPFGHSGTPPYSISRIAIQQGKNGAGGRIRTPDLLITNQLLYQLSYTSTVKALVYYTLRFWICQPFFSIFFVLPFSPLLSPLSSLRRSKRHPHSTQIFVKPGLPKTQSRPPEGGHAVSLPACLLQLFRIPEQMPLFYD